MNGEAGAPTGNVVERNISVGGRWSDVEAKAKDGISFRNNLTDSDPGFVSAATNDFRLKAGSPASAIGFQPIPAERMGVLKDSDRATWPVSHPVKLRAADPANLEAVKASSGPAPVVTVPRGAAPTIDGTLATGEWAGTPLVLEREVSGEVVSPPSRVFLRVSGGDLFVAFENTVEVGVPIRPGTLWGQDDAVEAALKVLGVPGMPTYVLRGFTGGKSLSTSEAGAADAAAARFGSAASYAAKVVSPSLWTAEMKIPLAALGAGSTKTVRLAANFTVRKTAGPNWVQWRGTGGSSWELDGAGTLIILP
jgi:hypothetical protein